VRSEDYRSPGSGPVSPSSLTDRCVNAESCAALTSNTNAPHVIRRDFAIQIHSSIKGERRAITRRARKLLRLIGKAARLAHRVSKNIRADSKILIEQFAGQRQFAALFVTAQLAQHGVRVRMRADCHSSSNHFFRFTAIQRSPQGLRRIITFGTLHEIG